MGFTSKKPTIDYLKKLFGKNVILEYMKSWGGKYGGATPDYYHQSFTNINNTTSTNSNSDVTASTTLPFLLYDCQRKYKGPGLYYVNSIEASAAAIEISAIGAKIVSKLVSYRLGIIDKMKKKKDNDE